MLTARFDLLELGAGQLCLDIGCGEGRHALAAHLGDGVAVLGLDLSERDLATARSRIVDMQAHDPKGWIAFGVGDATRLPLPDRSVDTIIASEILEHIPNYLRVLEELLRVLKPGGRLCVSVPRQWPEWICWQLSAGYRNTPGGHIRIFDAAHLRREIERLGLVHYAGHGAHALHVPYWWLKCLFWQRDQEPLLVRWYHRLLVWDLMRRPWLTRLLESVLNPIMGKSVVMYFSKLPDEATASAIS